jgi:hypothetical protein
MAGGILTADFDAHHDASMRTTVTLDPDVVELLQQAMAARRQSFKEVLNAAVRRGLADVDVGPGEQPFRWEPRAMGLRAGFDPARLNGLVDDLEADAVVEAMASSLTNSPTNALGNAGDARADAERPGRSEPTSG